MADTTAPRQPPKQAQNPLLARVQIPGETFTLPSGGLFYTDEIDSSSSNGEVLINPMTAIDEIIIRTPDKLFSGEGINDVFQRCVPQLTKGTALLAKDVDFVLLCLRKVTYGNQFDIKFTHTCEGAKSHEYSVNLDNFFQATRRIDPTSLEAKFTCKLSNGQKVKVNPIRFQDVINIVQLMKDEPSIREIKEIARLSIQTMIRSVDDVTDEKMIGEWVEHLQANLAKELSKVMNQTQEWGPSFEFKTACKDCGQEVDVAAPLNPTDFFTQL